MNKNSRTRNSALNLAVNVFYQIAVLFIAFFTRRVFIKNLGIDYLGISGLFTNILELFALAELGIGTAMSFSMYKHLADGNKKKLQELNTYYKKMYNRIALIILLVGLALLPFLKYIINLKENIPNVEIYYLINLLSSVFSYLFVYKTTIVGADQNGYRLKAVSISIEITKSVLQILAIVVLKSYLWYLLVQIICTVTYNIISSKLAEKWYPFIKEDAELPKKEKKELWDNIKSMFCYKMGNSVMNHTDNILTSILVSTTTVGLFSNYTMIYIKISSFINIIFGSITASVGNLNVTSTATEKYRRYKVLELMSYFLFAVAGIGIWFIADEVVIAMSATTEYLLDRSILVVIIINYYIMGLLNPNCVFRQTSGLFKVAKYSMVVCCILNIVFSIIFGKIWGLFGIILGSIVSRLLTNVWYEPYVLYKKFFDKNPMEYYIREGLRILIVLAIIMLLTPLINLVDFYNLYLRIGVKFIICLTIPTMILILINWRSEEFQYLLDKVKFIFKSYKDKLKN